MTVSNKENNYLINEEINFPEVLLITEENKEKISIKEALSKAKENDLDLVCVSLKSIVPVCKLMNYKKHLFNENKKNKKKPKKSSIKEIKTHMNTSERDFLIKIEKIQSWINSGGVSMIKIILNLSRREIIHPEVSREKSKKMIETILNNISNIELKDNKIIENPRNFCFYIQKKKNI